MTRQKNGIWKLTDDEMNTFSVFCREAAERYKQLGMPYTQTEASDTANEIFDILDAVGHYEGI